MLRRHLALFGLMAAGLLISSTAEAQIRRYSFNSAKVPTTRSAVSAWRTAGNTHTPWKNSTAAGPVRIAPNLTPSNNYERFRRNQLQSNGQNRTWTIYKGRYVPPYQQPQYRMGTNRGYRQPSYPIGSPSRGYIQPRYPASNRPRVVMP